VKQVAAILRELTFVAAAEVSLALLQYVTACVAACVAVCVAVRVAVCVAMY